MVVQPMVHQRLHQLLGLGNGMQPLLPPVVVQPTVELLLLRLGKGVEPPMVELLLPPVGQVAVVMVGGDAIWVLAPSIHARALWARAQILARPL